MKGIGAIVLAAGGSSRLGRSKQLVEYQGVPLVRRAALAAFDAGARPVVVVVGADAENVVATLHGLTGISVCRNNAWQSGLASSLIAGLTEVEKSTNLAGVLVTLADQPYVSAAFLRQLMSVFSSGAPLVASGYQDGAGVPALFGREFFGDLKNLSGDKGANSLLKKHSALVKRVSLQGSGLDIDTEDDLKKLREGK